MASISVAGDTSGSVTLAAPAVAGSTTLTLPTTTSTLSFNGPAFSAYRSTNQTGLTNNAFNKVQINTKLFDTNSNFDATTNYRFTPTVAGYYQVNGNVELAGTGVLQCSAAIYKNGSTYCQGSFVNTSTTDTTSQVSTLVFLNGSTDYIELYAYNSASSSSIIGTSPHQTTFSASLVRGA